MPILKKITFLVLCLFSICIIPVESISGTVSLQDTIYIEDLLNKYRNHPFQWIFPEYFYKAEIIHVEKGKKPQEGYKKFEFYGLLTWIPTHYKQKKSSPPQRLLVFKADESNRFVVSLESEDFLMGTPEKRKREQDYFSAFDSAKEWYQKAFTLTPDMINEETSTGDLWIIHGKGMLFEDVRKIEIYDGDDYKAYVTHLKPDNPHLNMEIVIFHDKLPKHKFIRAGFKGTEISAKQFLETLE